MLAGGCLILASGCSNFSSQARNAEGVRLFQQARYHEAMTHFQEATYADPDNADGYYNLAATHHRLGVLEQDQTQLNQAEQYYNQCLDHDPGHRECYRGLAVLLGEQGRREESVRLIEGWVDRQPTSTDAKIELARLYDEFGDRGVAKEHLLSALTIDPANARALAALGRIREQMGESTQALADYQRSLYNDPFQPQVAARVAALQSTPVPILAGSATSGETRLAEGPTNSVQ
jgi:tetratricopeptide (TPR) repeat protein